MFTFVATNWDLFWAVAVQLAIAILACVVLTWLAQSWSRRILDLAALAIIGVSLAFLGLAWDRVWLARVLPVSNLIVLGNPFPLFTALLAANVRMRQPLDVRRRRGLLIALAVAGITSCIWPLIGRTPICDNRWTPAGDCIQTSRFTCSAACAATLLASHGIDATEQELAELCLTRRGTTWMGLYRGLKLKTAGTPWDVAVTQCSIDELRQLDGQPLILRVGLSRNADNDEQFALDMGWQPGVGHSVVLHRFLPGGCVEISDPTPSIGQEIWTSEELNQLWQGQVISLKAR